MLLFFVQYLLKGHLSTRPCIFCFLSIYDETVGCQQFHLNCPGHLICDSMMMIYLSSTICHLLLGIKEQKLTDWHWQLTLYCWSWLCRGPCDRRPGPGLGGAWGGGGSCWGQAPGGGGWRRGSRGWPWPASPWASCLWLWAAGEGALNICGRPSGHSSDLSSCHAAIVSPIHSCNCKLNIFIRNCFRSVNTQDTFTWTQATLNIHTNYF